MKMIIALRFLLVGAALASASCKTYSTATEKRPDYKAGSPAGLVIGQALKNPSPQPEVQIGRYLDAASLAADELKRKPESIQGRLDYAYATGRVFEVLHESKLQPWRTTLICPGIKGPWRFVVNTSNLPVRKNLDAFRVVPADRYDFKGTLIKKRSLKDGLGAPLITSSEGLDLTKIDQFAQGKVTYYGLTGILKFEGSDCTAFLLDPLSVESVEMAGHNYPLAADFTAPLALGLAELNPRQKELARLVKPDEFLGSARLARLQPYDPAKIPVLCIHGLGDSHATWVPLIESLRGETDIRKNYQFWFFSYPTGLPYPLMASVLRRQMDAFNNKYPGHKPFVVIGHSTGGMIARTLITDSGMNLWNAYFDVPPSRTGLSMDTRRIMEGALIFQPRRDISRVIFASASLGGSEMATSFLGKLGSRLVGRDPVVLGATAEEAIAEAKPPTTGDEVKRMPNSIDILDPKNRFLTTINAIPTDPRIPYHSIMGDRGKGGNLDQTKPVSTDGIVPYWSSHIEGAQSELIVPGGHWTNQDPRAIAEIGRILRQHLPQGRRG